MPDKTSSEAGVKASFTGPIEAGKWPDALQARVVSPGTEPRVFGYEVFTDLAQHYRLAEVLLLLLTGELPDSRVAEAFETACIHLAPAGVDEPPAHVALLARLCGASDKGVIGAATLALSEQAEHFAARSQPLLDYCNGHGNYPANRAARNDQERAIVDRLREQLDERGLKVSVFERNPDLESALVATLHRCGLRQGHQLSMVWCLSRFLTVCVEGFAAAPGDFASYPIRCPDYTYRAEDEE
jgi:hypothetical protein